jgi:hypothetical protein
VRNARGRVRSVTRRQDFSLLPYVNDTSSFQDEIQFVLSLMQVWRVLLPWLECIQADEEQITSHDRTLAHFVRSELGATGDSFCEHDRYFTGAVPSQSCQPTSSNIVDGTSLPLAVRRPLLTAAVLCAPRRRANGGGNGLALRLRLRRFGGALRSVAQNRNGRAHARGYCRWAVHFVHSTVLSDRKLRKP